MAGETASSEMVSYSPYRQSWLDRQQPRPLQLTGEFARAWLNENRTGRKNFLALREKAKNQPVEKVGAELRSMMTFLKRRKEEGVPQEAAVNA